jgi:hypothetical protein
MKIKHDDIIVDKESPFKNCKLDREKYATVLTNILKNNRDGFVLAIDNEWGTGKSTFIRMWKQYLENENFKTLYFNAWENDFESDPLIAILSDLKTLLPQSGVNYQKLLKTGISLSKSIIPIFLKAIAEKHINTNSISESIKAFTEDAFQLFEEEVNEFTKKKEDLLKFREELSKYIESDNSSNPVVYIIDELDRCKPDYAVKVLECVKHFFSVKGIVFVLSIDKKQLGNSIKGYYGSENIDSQNYLRRFIDIEYQLPEPDVKEHINYLFDYYEFNDFLKQEIRVKNDNLNKDADYLKLFSKVLLEKENMSLRNREKLFSLTRLTLKQFRENYYILPDILFFFVFLKQVNNEIYLKILRRELSFQEFVTLMENYLLIKPAQDKEWNFIHSFTYSLIFYQNYLSKNNQHNRLIDIESNVDKLNFDTNADHNVIINIIRSIPARNVDDISLDYLLNKINLTDNIIS